MDFPGVLELHAQGQRACAPPRGVLKDLDAFERLLKWADMLLQMCGSSSWFIPFGLSLPFAWRLLQCLRVYMDTGNRAQLLNALKYSTAFPVIILSSMNNHVVDEDRWDYFYKPLWLAAAFINSGYSYYWDVERDWDISFFSNRTGVASQVFRKSGVNADHEAECIFRLLGARSSPPPPPPPVPVSPQGHERIMRLMTKGGPPLGAHLCRPSKKDIPFWKIRTHCPLAQVSWSVYSTSKA